MLDRAPAVGSTAERLLALDLIRGVAVLGILVINITGFAGPIAGTLSPHVPSPGAFADEAWFAFALLVFEGKMRTLFCILFGASLLLFMDKADDVPAPGGSPGGSLQMRRLGWLAVFGYLHYLLFWWGDILFGYALAGFAAVAFRRAPPAPLAAAALTAFLLWHALLGVSSVAGTSLEHDVLAGTAPAGVSADYRAEQHRSAVLTEQELAGYRSGFGVQALLKWSGSPLRPLELALSAMGETLPLIMLGMALLRSGFFSGAWPRPLLVRLMLGGICLGGVLTAAFISRVWPLHFPPDTMQAGLGYWLAVPHLLMAAGYGAALMLSMPMLASSTLGRRLIAAGQMALSNYLGMTAVMTAVFYGWGLGLVGTIPERWLWPLVLGGWGLMLGCCAPWLARFRHGPLEWVWRSLTLGRIVPLRR
ncbi:MAG: DUF418 domain-containing protein [Pseudomonadota bacterium]